MQEVSIRLRFNRVCLGAARRNSSNGVIYRFDRDPVDRVMFLPAALQGLIRYGAKLANHHHALVKQIDWCPVVDGTPVSDWRRTVVHTGAKRSGFAVHEAFPPGAIIGLRAVLPSGITLEDFVQLLEIAGHYRGFSPYNNQSEKFGTFDVLTVVPRHRGWQSARNGPTSVT